ncbi:hypothetical protein MMC09_001176 [Bachmanniomyces sp. S44760]|nr:hypothetical protein [Bachmanniomyces sp. S44760]
MGLTEAIIKDRGGISENLKDGDVEATSIQDSDNQPSLLPTTTTTTTMAVPIMLPYPASKDVWACAVDCDRKEYKIGWTGAPQLPNLDSFPDIKDLTTQKVSQSKEKQHCWQNSNLIDYGAYAYVRRLDESCKFSIVKMAHHGDPNRQLLCREFEILKSLDTPSVVRVQQEPLSDENGIIGFYMQRLYKIPVFDLAERLEELKDAIERVHKAGIVFNDVSISNVMLDAQDRITLIDFGFAGRIGEDIPSFFPPWKSRRAQFSVETDNEAYNEVCDLCK